MLFILELIGREKKEKFSVDINQTIGGVV